MVIRILKFQAMAGWKGGDGGRFQTLDQKKTGNLQRCERSSYQTSNQLILERFVMITWLVFPNRQGILQCIRLERESKGKGRTSTALLSGRDGDEPGGKAGGLACVLVSTIPLFFPYVSGDRVHHFKTSLPIARWWF